MILTAGMWGAVAASSLLVGMLVAFVWTPSKHVLGLILGFGAGALFSAIAFELVDDAILHGSERLLAAGMFVGAITFIAGARLVDRVTGDRAGPDAEASAIVLGAGLDGVPESLAIGASLASGSGVSVALVAAVALSNFPEALGATIEMREAGHPRRTAALIWGGLVVVSALAAMLGYVVLSDADTHPGAWLDAFTAGAVMAMLADTMIPSAYRDGGRWAGLATVAGFSAAFLIG